MCGRYAFYPPDEAVKRIFRLDLVRVLEPRYNVAPTQDVPAVRAGEEGKRVFAMLHRGLVPRWAKVRSIGNRMINARAETVAEKPAYRDAFKKRRCLVLADGWYEWQVAPSGKQPWFIRRKDAQPFAFAGLWERWKDSVDGVTLDSCTILTTDAAKSIAEVHPRMPVVLPDEACDRWLDKDAEPDELQRLLGPSDPNALESWLVSRQVNAPKNQGPELIERI